MSGKRMGALALIFALLLGLCACGAAEPQKPAETAVRTFTDSLGRTVRLPEVPDKVAVSGPAAQMVVFALCPDKLAGIAAAWEPSAEEYLDSAYYALPVLGQLYGGHSTLHPETLLGSGAQVVIDVGEARDGLAEELDALQEQTGIPFVHITAALDTMGAAYRLLGVLMAMPEEAETLAAYCEEVYARGVAVAGSVEKARTLYLSGDDGLHAIARGSYHAEVLDLLTCNAAVVDVPAAKGTGNEVDLEQILSWDPEVIFFAPGGLYAAAKEDPLWQTLTAVRNGQYYEVPGAPYNWMGFPPSVQRLLGMLWMETILYPEAVDYDLKTEVQTYFSLFYHCELTDAQYAELVKNSIGK